MFNSCQERGDQLLWPPIGTESVLSLTMLGGSPPFPVLDGDRDREFEELIESEGIRVIKADRVHPGSTRSRPVPMVS